MKYIHIRSDEGRGSVTVAYKIENNTVSYNIARCCPTDNFCRRIGRNIARGRLEKHGPLNTFPFVNFTDTTKRLIEEFHPDYIHILPSEVARGASPLGFTETSPI